MLSRSMMTASELVRAAFDRLNAGDIPGTIELFHPDVVIINAPAIGLGVALPSHIFGADQVRALTEGIDLSKIDRKIESIRDVGDGVVSAQGVISFEGTWGPAQWLAHVIPGGSINYVEGHLFFRVA
jgi:ketosteroid isomerase-like protein